LAYSKKVLIWSKGSVVVELHRRVGMSGQGDLPVVVKELELNATGLAPGSWTAGSNDDDAGTSMLLIAGHPMATKRMHANGGREH
jgi:hypothetical protein